MAKKQNSKASASRSQWERETDKELYWRRQLADWEASGKTIRSFARSRGLPESAFYAWRREISIRDRESTVASAVVLPATPAKPCSTRVADARGRLIPLKLREASTDGARNGPFVPVTLIDDSPDITQPAEAPAVSSTSVSNSENVPEGTIDINLPGRSVLRVTNETDMGLLSKILAALEVQDA